MFCMYSLKLRKVVRLSDHRHFDHGLPFLCPEDIPHRIELSDDDVCKMHEEDGDKVQRMPLRKSTRFRVTDSGELVLVAPDSGVCVLAHQMPIRGRIWENSMRGSQMRGAG